MDQARGTEAVHARHGDIHKDDVWTQFPGFIDGLEAIGSFATDVPFGTTVEKGPNATTKVGMVVD
jgi:hypothetical protein